MDNSRKRRKQVFMDRPGIMLLDKETNELLREFKCLAEACEEMGVSPAGVRDNIHGYKPPYRFGYFMTKPDYLKKIEGKT